MSEEKNPEWTGWISTPLKPIKLTEKREDQLTKMIEVDIEIMFYRYGYYLKEDIARRVINTVIEFINKCRYEEK